MNIKISNPNKLIYENQNINKLAVIKYYYDISKLMLPHIKNRLLSVIRCHEGVNKECFFKKHPTNDKNMVNLFYDNNEEYFYIKTANQLIYQAQMGSIEFHTWASQINKLEQPNLMIFDLDPDEDLPLPKLRESVLKVKSVIDELNLTSFLKTSGGKGYHIVVPLKTKNWDTFYNTSQQIALLVEQKWKNLFTTNIRKSQRNGKIFIDYLRNHRGSTCVAPYSLRAREKATISFPISWDSLKSVSPNEITIKNYKKYINNSWDNFFKINQSVK